MREFGNPSCQVAGTFYRKLLHVHGILESFVIQFGKQFYGQELPACVMRVYQKSCISRDLGEFGKHEKFNKRNFPVSQYFENPE